MNIAESRRVAAEAKALAEAATKGEWACGAASAMEIVVYGADNERVAKVARFLDDQGIPNSALIAASRTLVPDLADRLVAALDRVEELEADSKYAKFGRLVVENIAQQNDWWGDEWSTEIMPLAVDAGLAEYGPYDPDVHGPNAEAEPGEDIWFWTPLRRQEEAENV